mgnify:CR=1 FL=1
MYVCDRVTCSYVIVVRISNCGMIKKQKKWVKIMNPLEIYLCDGSEEEASTLKALLCKEGMMKKVPKLDDCWHVATDPKDVARVESATVICHEHRDKR